MNKSTQIEKLLASFLGQLNEKELAKILDPCTKLKLNIRVLRGQNTVEIDGNWQTVGARHLELSTDTSPSEELWERILSVPAFSENPERPGDRKLREILLKIKQAGHMPYSGSTHQATINGILEGRKIPARMIYERNHKDPSLNGFWIRAIV